MLPVARWPSPFPQRGDLYVLAVGVNAFSALPVSMHLGFAANDADAIALAFKKNAEEQYRNVRTLVLSDGSADKPDRAAVIRALDFLKQAGPADSSVVFLA
ncbi:MAG TPA: hypothetical protein VFH22_07940, partial [Rhodocyclaceae bacterium]|nr:hypothetical protein [Rhodocyclaceae bacterium]